MPRVQSVQTYGTSRVSTRPIAGVKNTLDPVSAVAPVLNQATRAVGDLMQQRADQIDITAAREAHNQLTAWRQDRLRNPETGALNVKGKDAFDLPDHVGQEFDSYADTLYQGLQNNRQRQAFDRIRFEQRNDLMETLYAHAGRERDIYARDQADAAIKLSVSDAVANADNPVRIAQEQTRGEAVLRSQLQGQAPETVDQKVNDFRTAIHTGVIGRLLDQGQEQKARAYYDAAKEQINGDDRGKVEKALQDGSILGESQRQADTIRQAGGTLTQRLEKVRAIEDPEVRQRAQQLVEHDYAIQDAEARANTENVMVSAANFVDQGGLRAVPRTLISQMTPNQRMEIERYAKRNAEPTGGEGESNLKLWDRLWTMAKENPTDFAKEMLPTYIGQLSKSDYKELKKLQEDVRAGKPAQSDPKIEAFTSNTQVFDDILGEFKIKKDDPRALTLRRELDKRVEQAQLASGGKQLTHTEIREIADSLVGTVVLERGGWTNILPGGKPFFDRTKAASDLTIDDIPPNERTPIVNALRQSGRPVTDAAILDYYLRAKRKMGDIR